jgi:DNA excision repair protein ERCC-1
MAQTNPSTTEPKGKQRQPPVVHPASGNSIIINPCQRLNPIVECIRNVPKEFGDILPDYQVGKTTGVLFLRCLHLPSSSIPLAERILRFWVRSLRYHRLHPEYIHQRIERLGQSYNLRILLLMCDIVCPPPFSRLTLLNDSQSEHQEAIRELTRVCLVNNITVIVAWS